MTLEWEQIGVSQSLRKVFQPRSHVHHGIGFLVRFLGHILETTNQLSDSLRDDYLILFHGYH